MGNKKETIMYKFSNWYRDVSGDSSSRVKEGQCCELMCRDEGCNT